MKKTILLFVVFLLTIIISFCQEIEIVSEYPNSESMEQKKKSERYRIYYIHETIDESAFFSEDSILMSQNSSNKKDSRLELFNDSRFHFLYNIKYEIITKRDSETGEMTSVIIRKSDETFGTYSSIQIATTLNGEPMDACIRFFLKDNSIYDFDIRNKNEQVILLKK